MKESDTRDRIVSSGMALMHARGYNAVGVQEICEAARVHKGSFYHFFPSKRDLALAVIDRFWDIFQTELLTPAFADDIPPLARIQRFCQMSCQMVKLSLAEPDATFNGCLLGNFALEISHQDDAIREKLQEIFGFFVDIFERALSEAVEVGEISAIDARATAQELVAYYEGAAVLAKTYDDADLVERLLQKTLQIVHANSVETSDTTSTPLDDAD